MWIVALAWIYVVGLMAITEPSVVAGIMTLLTYCVLPLGILFYITGSKRRQARKRQQNGGTDGGDGGADSGHHGGHGDSHGGDGGGDGGD